MVEFHMLTELVHTKNISMLLTQHSPPGYQGSQVVLDKLMMQHKEANLEPKRGFVTSIFIFLNDLVEPASTFRFERAFSVWCCLQAKASETFSQLNATNGIWKELQVKVLPILAARSMRVVWHRSCNIKFVLLILCGCLPAA